MDAFTSKGKAVRSATRVGNREELSVAELERDLEIELRHLRTVLREVAANYVSALESDIERVVEAIGDNDRREKEGVQVRKAELQDTLDRLRTLKVKPEKGRLRDMTRMDKLIGELAEWAEELTWRKIQEEETSGREERAKDLRAKEGVIIEESGFGYIVIDGRRYERDVVIRPGGKVAKREKRLSKKRHGTAHRVSAKELEVVIGNRTPSILVVGTGHMGSLSLSDDAVSWLEKRGISYRALPTPEAIEVFRRAEGKKMAFLHVTC